MCEYFPIHFMTNYLVFDASLNRYKTLLVVLFMCHCCAETNHFQIQMVFQEYKLKTGASFFSPWVPL